MGNAAPLFAAGIASSSEFFTHSATGGGPNGTRPSATTFVSLMYRTLTGESADGNTAASYVHELQNGLPTGVVALQFVTSDAFRQIKVNQVYAVLGLTPTSAQVSSYVRNWFWNGGLDGVAGQLITSEPNVAQLAGVTLPANLEWATVLQNLLLTSTSYTDFANSLKALLGTEQNPCTATANSCANWGFYDLISTGGGTRGLPNSSVDVTAITAQISTLLPTQNNVDMDQSLIYPLRNSDDSLNVYLAGGVVKPIAGVILTANDGTYIIDGHHRWSTVYVINPYAQITAIDVGYVPSPQVALEQTQLAVGAVDGWIRQKNVQGVNLFTVTKEVFYAAVEKDIFDQTWQPDIPIHPAEVLAAFTKYLDLGYIDKDNTLTPEQKTAAKLAQIQNYLWTNVERMQANNQPIPGATDRQYMPQPAGNYYMEYLQQLETTVNYSLPVVSHLG